MATSCSTWSERIVQLVRMMNSFHAEGSSKAHCSQFCVAGHQVGYVLPQVLKQLCRFPDVFRIIEKPDDISRLELVPELTTYEQRSAAMQYVLEKLKAEDYFPCLKQWRNEMYDVMPQFSDPPLFCMERAATSLFGVKRYGVHINGFVRQDNKEIAMWIARRSYCKQTYAGLLDNLAAGGLASGMGIRETLIKECQEESCIPESLAARAVPVSTISYTYEDERGIFPECQFVYDLEVPIDFVPRVGDGEVHEFYLWPLDKVKEAIASPDFKPNCSLVVLDFLIRHGYLDADTEKHYQTFVEGIHKTL
ncbi:nudix hydrolase 20, chloroplastic-like [Protopterus annectens]|uniref:nudix hydrolase 20, chloroplastic-like n=1 Tax=Protopterus annectens TaxID=7888 RepID=UPI001CF957FB|nr:nudix hydrolase 20, chloroplastic-like [Protopterus annectens]